MLREKKSNIVWWILGGFSRDLNKPIEDIASLDITLLIGKELADLTHSLPGHYSAEAFLHRVLQTSPICQEAKLVKFEQIIESEGSIWDTSGLVDENFNKVKEFCPIHSALLNFNDDKESWKRKFNTQWPADVTDEHPILTLSYQFYRERLLIRSV